MKKAFFLTVVAVVSMALFACKSAPSDEAPSGGTPAAATAPAGNEAPAAANTAANTAAAPDAGTAQAAAQAPAGGEAAAAATAGEAGDEERGDDPDDENWGGTGATVDRDRLQKAYEEVYCAQKKNEMERILDIYKNYGFEKPADFMAMWMEAAKDTAWIALVARDAAAKCH